MTRNQKLVYLGIGIVIVIVYCLSPYRTAVPGMIFNSLTNLIKFGMTISTRVSDTFDASLKGSDPETLNGTWIESQEESMSQNGTLVYRNSKDYAPGPSWYTHTFVFNNNGTCKTLVLASNDAHYMKDIPCSFDEKLNQEYLILGNTKYLIERRTESKLRLKKVGEVLY